MNRIRRFGKIATALALLAVLTGCVVEPLYGRPHHYYGAYYR